MDINVIILSKGMGKQPLECGFSYAAAKDESRKKTWNEEARKHSGGKGGEPRYKQEEQAGGGGCKLYMGTTLPPKLENKTEAGEKKPNTSCWFSRL